jgi:hypothetical protein
MARAFILGHGARIPGEAKTFVPTGRSISFYSDVDEVTLRANGFAALSAGDIPPVAKFDAGSEIDNYELTRFEDEALAQHMATESSLTRGLNRLDPATTYFVGLRTKWRTLPLLSNPLLLCSNPAKCALTKPEHSGSCEGLFAVVPEEDILSVSCRSVQLTQEQRDQGAVQPNTTRLGARTGELDDEGRDTSEAFFSKTEAEAVRLWQQSQKSASDRARVVTYLESLSEPTRQMLFESHLDLKTVAEEYYDSLVPNEPGASWRTTSPHPLLRPRPKPALDVVLEARRALEALGEDSFADRVDAYLFDPDRKDVEPIPEPDPEGLTAEESERRKEQAKKEKEQREKRKKQREQQRDMVLADPELKAAYDRSAARRTQAERDKPRLDLEAVQREKATREKFKPEIEAIKRRMAAANSGVGAEVRKAAHKERTRQELASMDPSAFVAMFNGRPAEQQAWMREIPEVVQTLRTVAEENEYHKWMTGPQPTHRPRPKAPPSVQKQRLLAAAIAAMINTASDNAAAEPTFGGLAKSDTSQKDPT